MLFSWVRNLCINFNEFLHEPVLPNNFIINCKWSCKIKKRSKCCGEWRKQSEGYHAVQKSAASRLMHVTGRLTFLFGKGVNSNVQKKLF